MLSSLSDTRVPAPSLRTSSSPVFLHLGWIPASSPGRHSPAGQLSTPSLLHPGWLQVSSSQSPAFGYDPFWKLSPKVVLVSCKQICLWPRILEFSNFLLLLLQYALSGDQLVAYPLLACTATSPFTRTFNFSLHCWKAYYLISNNTSPYTNSLWPILLLHRSLPSSKARQKFLCFPFLLPVYVLELVKASSLCLWHVINTSVLDTRPLMISTGETTWELILTPLEALRNLSTL